MKELNFLLLLFIINFIGFAEAVETSKVVRYHGPRRYWTSVDLNGKTYISLNVLEDSVTEPVNLIFPKNKDIGEILSGISLYSPANDECRRDSNTLGFKLVLDDRNFIRGDVKPWSTNKKIMAKMYEACPGVDGPDSFAYFTIDGQYKMIGSVERRCFLDGALFQGFNHTKNFMTLEVSGSHKCQVFMTMPAYIDVLDLPALPPDAREPVNSTFAEQGEEFWWKAGNNESLPDALAFQAGDVTIDIAKSTKANPYFLRIGKDQPYPSLDFKFDPACTTQQYDLFINLRDGDDCRIKINLTEHGIKLTAKDGKLIEFIDPTKSPTLVFARGQSKLYAKAGSHLHIAAMKVCEIENLPDVPDDQFVLQFAPAKGSAVCNVAKVTLPVGDVKSKIEVLLDRAKAAAFLAKAASNGTGTNETIGNTTVAAAGLASSTADNANAGFPWYYVVGSVLAVLAIAAIGITVYCCIRHRRKKQNEQKKGPPPCSRIKREPAIRTTETAIPVDEPPPKNKKDKSESAENKKGTKPEMIFSAIPLKKPRQISQKKPVEDQLQKIPIEGYQRSAIPTAQDDATVQTGSTQNPTNETVENVDHGKLLYRSMYGPEGFVHMNDPYDYHKNDSETFEFKVNSDALKCALSPPLLQFQNFWSCIEKLSDPKRFAGVYVDSKTPGSDVFFLVRDCVADEPIYYPFRYLANRILEPLKELSGDGEKKLFVVRVFILAYEPLTIEVHCRGQCPLFLFNLFDCEECPEIGRRLQMNPTQAISREKWETFLCRVKRTPINSHQFLSYNGPGEVKNGDEINHMIIIRGEKKPNKLRECTRGCSFKDSSHPNNFQLEAELLGDHPTIQTETTQKSSTV